MNTDTMKDIIRDAHALAKSQLAEDLIRSGAELLARRLERLVARGLYITPKVDVPPAAEPVSPGVPEMKRGEEEREHMSRAEAVRILMQLQVIEARAGNPNINDALEMAVANLIRRHRQFCRNKAKCRAARMANSAAKEVS